MNSKKSFVYVRENKWYKNEKVVKVGVTSFLKDRENTYITGEYEKGNYILVIEVPTNKINLIDRLTKSYFKKYNIYNGGGTEFYKNNIVEKIHEYLLKINIDCKVLTEDEIEKLDRKERLNFLVNHLKKTNLKYLIQKFNRNTKNIYGKIIPHKHQNEVLNKISDYYVKNNKGKINWACGLGKALLSMMIVKKLNFKNVIFGVPNRNLQNQISKEILKVFPNKDNILLIGGYDTSSFQQAKTAINIDNFLNKNNNTKFLITTYHSCYLLVNDKFHFDLKIGDEAHHLTGINEKTNSDKNFLEFHKIKSKKSLFMTATEKIKKNNKYFKELYSMDDEKVFGEYIDIRTVHWAIENKKITDYYLLVLKNTFKQVDDIISNIKINVEDKNLFISCYMTLKSLLVRKGLSHILLYTNNTDDTQLTKYYIDELLKLDYFKVLNEDFYNEALHSKNCKSSDDLKDEINNFQNHKYGVISCVFIFGEGFDLPKLNGVCVSCNMQSEIRIVQYLLRPNRLEKNNPDKKAYIIIPYIEDNNIYSKNESYLKLLNVVSHMRNVDKNISSKIILYSQNNELIENKDENRVDVPNQINIDLEENKDDLKKLIIKLRHSKGLYTNFTEEQNEYEYIKFINSKLNISSIEEYNLSQNIHENFIENPDKYFRKKGVWKGWYDFFGLDTKNLIKTKSEWIKFCYKKNIRNSEQYKELCKKIYYLPKEPELFYPEFTNINYELGLFNKNKQTRR